jgi:hypothetical protein
VITLNPQKPTSVRRIFFSFRAARAQDLRRDSFYRTLASIHPECPLYGIGIDQDEEIEFPLEVIELKKNDPNYRLISDYTYWSNTWR